MTAVEIIELATLRQVDPTNPVADRLITRQLESGQSPTPLFYTRLQVAWRDGAMSEAEIAFCEQMRIEPVVYVRMRFAVTPRTGESRFDAVRRRVFDLE